MRELDKQIEALEKNLEVLTDKAHAETETWLARATASGPAKLVESG